jgi:hypothetical protein
VRLAQMKKRSDNSRMDRGPRAPGDTDKWKFEAKNYIGVDVKTLDAILKNPKEQQLLGELLNSVDKDMASDTFAKLASNENLSKENRDFLRYGIYELSKWLPRAEKVSTRIKPSDVEIASRRNADLDTDVALRGKERVAELFQEQTLKLAMRDPQRFQELEKAYKALDNDRSKGRYVE